jgi:hypothetical protein
MGWNLLSELDQGCLSQEKPENNALHLIIHEKQTMVNSVLPETKEMDYSYRHRLMVRSVYGYIDAASDGYVLTVNGLVRREVLTNPHDFLKGAKLPAFKVILKDPIIIAGLQEKGKLSAFLKKAVELDLAKFKNWSYTDFEQALADKPQEAETICWGMLTQSKIVDSLQPDKLKEYVKKLELNTLSNSQIEFMDKKARIAVLENLGGWNDGKAKLGDEQTIPERVAALTHDFDENDIEKLEYCETGLIASFKKNPAKVTKIIAAQKDNSVIRRMGWNLLQELDNGFLSKDQELRRELTEWRFGGMLSYLHQFVATSVYCYTGTEGYDLKVNELIRKEVSTNPKYFKKNATLAAFKVILSDPAIVKDLNKEKQLGNYLAQAAILGFSASEFLSSITINPLKEDKIAVTALCDALPAFLKKNTKFDTKNMQAIKELHALYRQSYPVAELKNYKEDPIIKAVKSNSDYKGDKEKLLGLVIFSDINLIKSFVAEQGTYEVKDLWLLAQIKTIGWGMLLGALTAGVVVFLKDVLHIVNPFSWMAPQIESFFRVGIGVATGVLTGSGIAGTVAVACAPILVGAAVGVVAALTLSTTWNTLKNVSRWSSRAIKLILSDNTLPEGRAEFEIIKHGLKTIHANNIDLLLNDPDQQKSRENLAKTLLFCYDKGFDINDHLEISAALRRAVVALRDNYYYKAHPIWRRIVNMAATLTGGLFGVPPWYQEWQLTRFKKTVTVANEALKQPKIFPKKMTSVHTALANRKQLAPVHQQKLVYNPSTPDLSRRNSLPSLSNNANHSFRKKKENKPDNDIEKKMCSPQIPVAIYFR